MDNILARLSTPLGGGIAVLTASTEAALRQPGLPSFANLRTRDKLSQAFDLPATESTIATVVFDLCTAESDDGGEASFAYEIGEIEICVGAQDEV